MDAARAFEVALDHYRKGNDCLHYPVAVLMEEQALHLARATAHFSAVAACCRVTGSWTVTVGITGLLRWR